MRSILGIMAIVSSAMLFSCEKESNSNSKVSNPAEEIVWLKEAIDDIKQDEYAYYAMANYKGDTVFYYGNCNPVINYVSVIQNCKGEKLGYTSELYDKLTDIKIIWKHANSKCNFQE
jgi:hypothetical protein